MFPPRTARRPCGCSSQHPIAYRRYGPHARGRVPYAGETSIAGAAAPIRLDFLDAWGATTGSVFPTGHRVDVIEGVEVTCIGAAMPLMIARAADLGVTGRETPEELDAHPTLRSQVEILRRAAGRMMASATSPSASFPNRSWSATGPGRGA